jgi:histidine ammonia-lyase
VTKTPLRLTGSNLTAADLARIAREGLPVSLAPEALERMAQGRAVVERHLAAGEPVYGLTTGLGARVGHRLEEAALADFSRLTILGRSNAVGERLPRELVRATMAARLNGLLLGGAGVQVAVAEHLAAALNAGFHPAMASIGSIGAGDLCVLATMTRGLIGEGEAEVGGEVLPATAALAKAGLEPLTLGPKDGLSLANASGFSAALAALAYHDAGELLVQAQAAAALSLEGFRASTTPLDPRCAAARPAPGQQQAAAELLVLLEGSDLLEPGAARRLQDPLSLRCVAQINGAAIAALDFLAPALDAELNGTCDNPLVLIEEEQVLSTGNFHTTVLALGLETLAQAFAHLAAASASRAMRMLTGRLTDLPDNLTNHGSGRSGFAPLSKVLESLVQEIRHLAQPAPQEQRWGADGVEDDVNATPLSGKKARELLSRVRYVLAIEALVAAQAVELRGNLRLGRGTGRFHAAIRAVVPPLADDRAHGPDVEVLAEALAGYQT